MPGEPKEPGMPPSPDETNRDVVDFDKFEFRNLYWPNSDIRGEAKINGKVNAEGQIINFHAVRELDRRSVDVEIIFFGQHGATLQFHFEYEPRKNDSAARVLASYIGRLDLESDTYGFPRGFGMTLYRKLLNHIQHLANSTRRRFVHEVCMTSEGEEKIEDWHKHFDPILQEFGYKQNNEREWEKTYKPIREQK